MLGDQAAISKSTVAQVCQAIKTEYDTWARRLLGDVVLDYLFLEPRFSGCIPARRPSRSWPHGVLPPRASPSLWAWPLA
ncbi:transposase, mutator type [Mycobacterium intracellulare subsp. yongonense]|nr:transposase, mutator type [Mycobacterium intracellulare subsp. yongonense]ARR82899.1 transposase, mutator type [Mycobacterium intracellulare subsp. yongonense]